MTELAVRAETWPIRGSFTISRGSRTAAEVVVVELADGGALRRILLWMCDLLDTIRPASGLGTSHGNCGSPSASKPLGIRLIATNCSMIEVVSKPDISPSILGIVVPQRQNSLF